MFRGLDEEFTVASGTAHPLTRVRELTQRNGREDRTSMNTLSLFKPT